MSAPESLPEDPPAGGSQGTKEVAPEGPGQEAGSDVVSEERTLPAARDGDDEEGGGAEAPGESAESGSAEEAQESSDSVFWLSPLVTPTPTPDPEVTDAAGPSVEPPRAPEPGPSSSPIFYMVKWITWKEKQTPIITQSQNGPCPLLAIMNTLFLRWKASLPAWTDVVSSEDLMTRLGECVWSVTPRENTAGMELNFQQNMSDVMAVLPKLSTGLDVNVRFTGVTDFEYTPECIVFDLLNIPLFHGWLVDPQNPEMAAAVGNLSYNQLVEKIIHCKHSEESSLVTEGLLAEQFLESTATQLSFHGLCELNARVKEDEISVFFRNNHFSTMIKHQGHLYLLVTDQGFLEQKDLVWESLHNLDGDGNFCDCNFRLIPPQPRLSPAAASPSQRQIQQDFLVAMSLLQQQEPGGISDLDLARQLQQEEYQQHQEPGSSQAPPPAPAPAPPQAPPPRGARTRDKDSDCILL